MAKRELKYWVFEQDKLNAALIAFVRASVAQGTPEADAKAEAVSVLEFLGSPSAQALRGGRAG